MTFVAAALTENLLLYLCFFIYGTLLTWIAFFIFGFAGTTSNSRNSYHLEYMGVFRCVLKMARIYAPVALSATLAYSTTMNAWKKYHPESRLRRHFILGKEMKGVLFMLLVIAIFFHGAFYYEAFVNGWGRMRDEYIDRVWDEQVSATFGMLFKVLGQFIVTHVVVAMCLRALDYDDEAEDFDNWDNMFLDPRWQMQVHAPAPQVNLGGYQQQQQPPPQQQQVFFTPPPAPAPLVAVQPPVALAVPPAPVAPGGPPAAPGSQQQQQQQQAQQAGHPPQAPQIDNDDQETKQPVAAAPPQALQAPEVAAAEENESKANQPAVEIAVEATETTTAAVAQPKVDEGGLHRRVAGQAKGRKASRKHES